MARLAAGTPVGGTAQAAIDADTLLRSVLFIAVFLLAWISLHPFPSLAEPLSAVTEGGDLANQIGYSTLFVTLAVWSYFHQPARLALVLRTAFVVLLIWCAVTVVTSRHWPAVA